MQYIRINKAYLGEVNALDYAQIADSINYDTAIIRASLAEYRSQNLIRTLPLHPVWMLRAEDPSSPFYNPNFPYILMYQTGPYEHFKVTGSDTTWLNPESEFRLLIQNTKTGKEIASSTIMVNDFSIKKPLGNFITVYNRDAQNTVQGNSEKNGVRYQTMFRFYYKEFTNAFDTVLKSADYEIGIMKNQNAGAGEQMDISFNGLSFYKFLSNNIPFNTGVKRLAWRMELNIAVIPEEFNTYLEVNEPSSSIVQERPEYTNIVNGFGIFTSRFLKKRTYKIGPSMESEIVAYFNTLDGSFILSPTQ